MLLTVVTANAQTILRGANEGMVGACQALDLATHVSAYSFA